MTSLKPTSVRFVQSFIRKTGGSKLWDGVWKCFTNLWANLSFQKFLEGSIIEPNFNMFIHTSRLCWSITIQHTYYKYWSVCYKMHLREYMTKYMGLGYPLTWLHPTVSGGGQAVNIQPHSPLLPSFFVARFPHEQKHCCQASSLSEHSLVPRLPMHQYGNEAKVSVKWAGQGLGRG